MKRVYVSLIFLVCSLASQDAISQTSMTRSFSYAEKEAWFDHQVGILNSGVVMGSEYHLPFQSTDTHPFFATREASVGNVLYHRQLFKKVSLLYDIYKDQLVYKQVKTNGMYNLIQLNKEDIQEFNLLDHNFRKLTTPFGREEFVDVLFEGENLTLVVKRQKTDRVNQYARKVEYEQTDQAYLIRKGKWILFNKENIYSYGSRKTVRDFIKTFRIRLNQVKDADLIRIAVFLDSLHNVQAGQ